MRNRSVAQRPSRGDHFRPDYSYRRIPPTARASLAELYDKADWMFREDKWKGASIIVVNGKATEDERGDPSFEDCL